MAPMGGTGSWTMGSFDSGTKAEKAKLVEKILPKIVEKGMPTQITGEEGGAIIIQVAEEIKIRSE